MKTHGLSRRMFLAAASALALVAGAVLVPGQAMAQESGKKRVLFLTKSSGFQHSVITRRPDQPDQPAHAERLLSEFAGQHGYEVTFTKDASLFNDPETYRKYDVFAFYTTGDLTRPSDKYAQRREPGGRNVQGELIHREPAMSVEGKQMFLKALEDGKGFIGFHCASDTFHSPRPAGGELLGAAGDRSGVVVDPYIAMVGGEFAGHGSQQNATMRVASSTFPGLEDLKDFEMHEEWYNLINLARDMHVILIQDTSTMKAGADGKRERDYQRPPYPATWARKHGNGRVFYTSMGHREDVWTDPIFQKVVIAGLNWVSGRTEADVTPNIERVTPQYQVTKE